MVRTYGGISERGHIIKLRQSTYQSAQKSTTTMREDERREENWDGDVIATVFDMLGDFCSRS